MYNNQQFQNGKWKYLLIIKNQNSFNSIKSSKKVQRDIMEKS